MLASVAKHRQHEKRSYLTDSRSSYQTSGRSQRPCWPKAGLPTQRHVPKSHSQSSRLFVSVGTIPRVRYDGRTSSQGPPTDKAQGHRLNPSVTSKTGPIPRKAPRGFPCAANIKSDIGSRKFVTSTKFLRLGHSSVVNSGVMYEGAATILNGGTSLRQHSVPHRQYLRRRQLDQQPLSAIAAKLNRVVFVLFSTDDSLLTLSPQTTSSMASTYSSTPLPARLHRRSSVLKTLLPTQVY